MSTTHTTSDNGGKAWLWMAILPLSIFLALVWGIGNHSLPWAYSLPWVPSIGIELAFRIDALSAQMLVLITGIGTLVFVYAVGYLDHEPNRGRIFLVLPVFMLAMIGAVTADNIILLFLFWELTSLTSFLLVGFNHKDADVRDSARQALLVTMGGGLALLGGLLLLGQIVDTWSLSGIISQVSAHTSDPRLPWAILLVLLGAFTKSAQFPFHFWLPNAMSAPTPVSAYLHSATMVKLGIYLMARLDPAFNNLLLWETLLIGVGTLTAVWAAVLTLRERDLKRILARSTVSALGTMTLLIGLPSPGSGLALMTFMFAHALYKAPLFMLAGNIDHATGTRVIDRLMGLRRVMPWSAVVAILAGISMAGLPLAFGFVAKDMISIAKEQTDLFISISYALVIVNAITVAVAGVATIRVFWGPLKSPRKKTREVSWTMILPPLIIALVGIEFEFFPHIADPLLLAAAQNVSPDLVVTELSASYEPADIFSALGITMVIGIVLFFAWDRLHQALSKIHSLDFGPEAGYRLLLRGLSVVAAWHTRLIQPGRLDIYLSLTLSALMIMVVFAAWHTEQRFAMDLHWSEHALAWSVASLIITIGATAAALMRQRLAVLMASGLLGYGAAILFLFAGAPDLAFTQFSVETALVVVAAAVLPLYAKAPPLEPLWSNPLKLLLAVSAGIGTFLLLLHMQGLPESRQLADWFATNSLPEAHGRNVVNVIIVDFRALDTLGEIAVVAFSLLAAMPLLQGITWQRRKLPASPMLTMSAKPLYWLMLVGAFWILLRGHNEPGGGFIAGLVAVAASSQLAILLDPSTARRYQFLSPLALALTGVGLALFGGMFGALWGPGFLRHLWAGGLSSVMIFDLGVFLAVWGALMGYIYSLLEVKAGATNKLMESAS